MKITKCLFSILLLVLMIGCSRERKIKLSTIVEDEHVVFVIQRDETINSLLWLRVEDPAGGVIWDIDAASKKVGKIVYGVLPSGGNMPATQRFPLDGKPPVDIRGKTVTISVGYQFDEGLSASSGSLRQTMVIP